jgi:hypothetical protein
MLERGRHGRLGPEFRRSVHIPPIAEYESEDVDTNVIANLYRGTNVFPKWEAGFKSWNKRIFFTVGLSGWGKSTVNGQIAKLIHKHHPEAPVFHVRYDLILRKVMDKRNINQEDLKHVGPDFFREVNERLIDKYEAAITLAEIKKGFVVGEIFGLLGRGEDLIKYAYEQNADRMIVAALNTGTYVEKREAGIRQQIAEWKQVYPDQVGELIGKKYGIYFRNQEGHPLSNNEIIEHYRLSASIERMNINLENFERGRLAFEAARPIAAGILRDGYGIPPRDRYHQWRDEDEIPWMKRGAYLTQILHGQWGIDPSIGYVVANPFRNRTIYMNIFTNEFDKS